MLPGAPRGRRSAQPLAVRSSLPDAQPCSSNDSSSSSRSHDSSQGAGSDAAGAGCAASNSEAGGSGRVSSLLRVHDAVGGEGGEERGGCASRAHEGGGRGDSVRAPAAHCPLGSLSLMLWALARLRCQAPSSWLHASLCLCAPRIPHAQPRELSMLSWALGSMGYRAPRVFTVSLLRTTAALMQPQPQPQQQPPQQQQSPLGAAWQAAPPQQPSQQQQQGHPHPHSPHDHGRRRSSSGGGKHALAQAPWRAWPAPAGAAVPLHHGMAKPSPAASTGGPPPWVAPIDPEPAEPAASAAWSAASRVHLLWGLARQRVPLTVTWVERFLGTLLWGEGLRSLDAARVGMLVYALARLKLDAPEHVRAAAQPQGGGAPAAHVYTSAQPVVQLTNPRAAGPLLPLEQQPCLWPTPQRRSSQQQAVPPGHHFAQVQRPLAPAAPAPAAMPPAAAKQPPWLSLRPRPRPRSPLLHAAPPLPLALGPWQGAGSSFVAAGLPLPSPSSPASGWPAASQHSSPLEGGPPASVPHHPALSGAGPERPWRPWRVWQATTSPRGRQLQAVVLGQCVVQVRAVAGQCGGRAGACGGWAAQRAGVHRACAVCHAGAPPVGHCVPCTMHGTRVTAPEPCAGVSFRWCAQCRLALQAGCLMRLRPEVVGCRVAPKGARAGCPSS